MRRLNRRGFTLVELMVVIAILSILVSIAIPNFMQLQTRVKQSEAKMNLKAIFTAEKAFYQANGRYTATINELGFAPERGNRYAYRLDAVGPLQGRNAMWPAWGSFYGVTVDTWTFQDPTLPSAPDPVMGIAPNAGTAGLYVDARNTQQFLATAAGNLDEDWEIDTWWVSSEPFTAMGTPCTAIGATFNTPGGTPFNSNNDVACE